VKNIQYFKKWAKTFSSQQNNVREKANLLKRYFSDFEQAFSGWIQARPATVPKIHSFQVIFKEFDNLNPMK